MDQTTPDADWVPPTWDEIVRDHSARVFRLAFRLTGNRHDAEDLTQEVFVRVFRSLSSYRPARSRAGCTASPPTSSSTRPAVGSGSASTRCRRTSATSCPAGSLRPTTPTCRSCSTTTSRSALSALKPEFRVAVVLCDIEGLSYDEIAAVLDVKIGTVRSRIHRGRSLLRKALAHRAPNEQPHRPTAVRLLPRVVRRQVRWDEPPPPEGLGSRRR